MSEITIPLNKMIPWSGNVRKTGAADGIAELATSIAAHGLLQSLVVRKAPRGKYAVVAGGRRYKALKQLAGSGALEADFPVPCRLLEGDADPTEISLAENVVRAPMHPADQFEAFRQLIDNGASAADVAARFGVSETIVAQRMKLGRVAPVLLDLYREGGMSLEQVKAFTVSDDQAAQERVWMELPGYGRHAGSIRQALTQGETPATDKRVQLVTLEAYEAAGGTIRRDLFDDRNAGYVLDPALLDRMVQSALETIEADIAAEGWKWVEIHPEFDWQAREVFERVRPQAAPLSDEDAAEIETLTEEAEAIGDMVDDEDDLPAEAAAHYRAINDRLDQMTDRLETFSEADRCIAGVVISLQHDGTIAVERGLVRPEDMPARASHAASSKAPAGAPGLPASLVEELTQHRTAALQVELASRPDIALAAVVHAMALKLFYGYGPESSLELRTGMPKIGIAAESSAVTALERERETWGEHLPGDAEDLWSWCRTQDQARLLDLLAVTAAHSLNAVCRKGEASTNRLHHADQLASSLSLDMTAWYAPTAKNFFSRIPKSLALDALAEARQQPNATAWAKLKKAELADLTERHVAGTGWLPGPLRSVSSAEEDSARSMASDS